MRSLDPQICQFKRLTSLPSSTYPAYCACVLTHLLCVHEFCTYGISLIASILTASHTKCVNVTANYRDYPDLVTTSAAKLTFIFCFVFLFFFLSLKAIIHIHDNW